jgi:hypothetical protein
MTSTEGESQPKRSRNHPAASTEGTPSAPGKVGYDLKFLLRVELGGKAPAAV